MTWEHPRGVAGLRAAAEAFSLDRPDVSVEWEARSLQAFADHPVEELARRFDLVVLDHPAIGQAVAHGALVPLDEHLAEAVLADQETASVGHSAGSYVWEGHRWGLAIDAAAQVAAVREDLLDGLEAPRSWDDVLALASALRQRERWIAMPAVGVDVICAFLAVCAALGEDPCRGDDVVTRQIGRQALDLLGRVLAAAHPDSFELNPPRTLARMSTTDQIAYVPLAFGYVTHAMPSTGARALRFTGGPAGEDGTPRGTLGGAGVAVSAHAADRDAACAFAAFAASAAVQAGLYVEAGGQPGHRSAWTDPDVNAAHGGFFAATLDAVDAAYLRERHDGFVAFQQQAGESLHKWLRDARTGSAAGPDRVLDELDERFRASRPARAEVRR